MSDVSIRVAGPADMAALDGALRGLSDDLGDEHIASADRLAAACHGPVAFAVAVVAETQEELVGAALFSPAFSTTLGGPGVVVSDVWVAAGRRGEGLGARLLGAAARYGEVRWDAIYLRLTADTDNNGARRFYERLGFRFREQDRNAILSGDGFHSLAEAEG